MRKFISFITTLVVALALLVGPVSSAQADPPPAPPTAPGCSAAQGHGPSALWNSDKSLVYGRTQHFCLYGQGSENRQLHWIGGDIVIYSGNSAPGGHMLEATNLGGHGVYLFFTARGGWAVTRQDATRTLWSYASAYPKAGLAGWKYATEMFTSGLQHVSYAGGTYQWSPQKRL